MLQLSSKSDKEVYSIEKLDDEYFAYNLSGKLIDKKLEKIMIGKLLLELESIELPGDISDGDFISFRCQRLDII